MTSRIQSAATALLLGLSVLAPSMASGQATGDRGRPVDQMPLVMRSLVIDVLSKGLKSGSRPLLRRVLADPVLLNGVATDREDAIDAINADLAVLRRSNHRLVVSQPSTDPAASQLRVVVSSVPDSVDVRPESPGETAAAVHGRSDKSVRPTEKSILSVPDTPVGPLAGNPQVWGVVHAESPASQICVFALEDKNHQGDFRVTSVSLASSLQGR